jgi:sn-glycerol 3-phosphate transport system ATP-binding protein
LIPNTHHTSPVPSSFRAEGRFVVSEVAFHEVTKVFPGGATAVETLNLLVRDGEFLVLVGPSGCGKTTALRMVAGLDEPTSGAIAIGDAVVNGVPPQDRDVAMVFQSYALYPHQTVRENLAFGLRQRKVAKELVRDRVREVSELLALEELMDRKPAQLSGGQRQRVAMGRALARSPQVFLLDEPLSNLDAQLRTQLRSELRRIHQLRPTTSIYVTHDQVEAMTLGDRVAVMNHGHLLQLGTPQEIYRSPANVFVASFIGSPPMNLLRGNAAEGRVHAGSLSTRIDGVRPGPLLVGIRPEAFHLPFPGPDGRTEPTVEVRVDVVELLGHETILYGSVRGEGVNAIGTERGLAPLSADRATIVARLDARGHPSVGQTVALAFAPEDLRLFDAETGAALPGSITAPASTPEGAPDAEPAGR